MVFDLVILSDNNTMFKQLKKMPWQNLSPNLQLYKSITGMGMEEKFQSLYTSHCGWSL